MPPVTRDRAWMVTGCFWQPHLLCLYALAVAGLPLLYKRPGE